MRTVERSRLCRIFLAAVLVCLARHGAGAEHQDGGDTKAEPEQRLVETGKTHEELASFDALMRSFVRENEIPGAALAVACDGRLLYARGFGYADVKQKQPVKPESLFRIASLSKPITSVAIGQLVDRGRLKLDDRVFDLLPHKPHLPHDERTDPRLKTITIHQLLHHTAGWDRDLSIDPMFRSVEIAHRLGVKPPARPDHIVRFMMGWELDFEPGTRYAYSNFGYCLLGRVIEQTTGRSYEQHVRTALLKKLGIESMRIGKTLPAGRAPGEVCYYVRRNRTGTAVVGDRLGAKVPRPYGAWYLEAMDSHGGWIASVVDLMRFAVAVEDNNRSKLLSPESAAAMFAPPKGEAGRTEDGKPRRVYYGLGWSVRQVGDEGKINRWHTGSLAGTSSLLVIRHDGLCWAVLFNTNQTRDGKSPADKIDPLVHRAADAVRHWPKHDLFSK